MVLSNLPGRRVLLVVLLATAMSTLVATVPTTSSASGPVCADFPNQAAAQAAANTRDADHDGIYCEDLPCPCSPEWHAQHEPAPAPAAPPIPDPAPPPSPAPTPPSSSSTLVQRSTPAPGSLHSHVSPLDDARGLHPGLSAVPRSKLAAARTLIAQVRTGLLGAKTGYARTQFGTAWTDTASGDPWAGNGCDTRDDILHRDLTNITVRSTSDTCIIASGQLRNPYLGTTIRFTKTHATLVQIDHVIPLSLAWQLGARRWTRTKRVQLANDPLNLLAVDGRSNEQKGDSGPADWLPTNPRIRCAYSVRLAQVARKYNLPITKADKTTMRRQCGG